MLLYMKNYSLKLAIFAIALMSINLVVDTYLILNINLNFTYVSIVLFYIITIFTHFLLLKVVKNKPKAFASWYMLTIMIKLVAYFIYAVSYVLLYRGNAKEFLITYFIIYLLFAIVGTNSEYKIAGKKMNL